MMNERRMKSSDVSGAGAALLDASEKDVSGGRAKTLPLRILKHST